MSGKSARKKRAEEGTLRFAQEQAVTLGAYCAYIGKKMFAQPGNPALARIDALLREHIAFSAFVREARASKLKMNAACGKAMKAALEIHVAWERGKQSTAPKAAQPKNRLLPTGPKYADDEELETTYVCCRCKTDAPSETTIARVGWERRKTIWYHRCPDDIESGFIHPRQESEDMASARGLLDDLMKQNLEQVAEGNLAPNETLSNCLRMLGRDPEQAYADAKPGDDSNEAGLDRPAQVPPLSQPAPAPAPVPPPVAPAPAPQVISPQGIPPTNAPGIPGAGADDEPGIPPLA